MSTQQKSAFIEFEADAWFERNKASIESYQSGEDSVIKLIRTYGLKPKSVLEIGSSSGYRLNGIRDEFGSENLVGVDPSGKAIEHGRSTLSFIEFHQSTADDLSMIKDNSFDMVIMGFVFYVIDRELFLRAISEIDRVLKNGGYLILIDFYSGVTLKNKYHHIDSFEAYSYKQNYDEVFTATRLYHLLSRSTYNHDSGMLDGQEDFSNLFSISLLKKDLHAAYK